LELTLGPVRRLQIRRKPSLGGICGISVGSGFFGVFAMSDEEIDFSNESSATYSVSASLSGLKQYWTRYEFDLPPDYCAAIGEVCARWAWLEFQCGVIAREVLSLDKTEGYAITGGMSMRSISTVLKALALGKTLDNHPTLKAAVGDLGKKLSNIGDFRNEYAHGIWGYEKEGNPQLGLWKFKRPEDRAEPNWVNKPLATVQDAAATLREFQVQAQQLTWDLKDVLRKKPAIRRPLG
jgi:hypothetical protein